MLSARSMISVKLMKSVVMPINASLNLAMDPKIVKQIYAQIPFVLSVN
jgi:hypothetical protein